MNALGKYRKLIVALVGGVVAVVGALYGVESAAYTTVVAVATALGVWGVSNTP